MIMIYFIFIQGVRGRICKRGICSRGLPYDNILETNKSQTIIEPFETGINFQDLPVKRIEDVAAWDKPYILQYSSEASPSLQFKIDNRKGVVTETDIWGDCL